MTFDEVMNSNIRPKCEPKITVSGTDINGDTQTIVWNAKDIKSLTFKRSIDPVGRNLPVMELQWTEVYYGKFNAQNFPIKYNNLTKYMAVTLEFNQSLSFFRTWKDIKSLTWKNLKEYTWKALKNDVPKETVTMPMMFLSATPEVSGHTIKWTAKDALSFLTEVQTKAFATIFSDDPDNISIPFYNPIVYLLVNARATFYHSKELFDYYTRTINYFNGLDKTKLLTHGIIFDGATNSEIMNYLSPLNEYLDFDNDKIIVKTFTAERTSTPTVNIPLKLQYGSPTLESCTPVSRYSYNQYVFSVHKENAYELSPATVSIIMETTYIADYYYNGYGVGYKVNDDGTTNTIQTQEINRAIASYFYGPAANPDELFNGGIIKVNPVNYEAIAQQITTSSKVGEIYDEDNKLNVWDTSEIRARASALSTWFDDKNHVVKNQTPAMFNWEIGTFANCETPLFNNDGTQYVAPAMLLEYTVEYNGAIKQSNIAHEIGAIS